MIAQKVGKQSFIHRIMLVGLLLLVTLAGMAAPVRRVDSLDFAKADIAIVLRALADMSGANIVIGPTVKGEITIKLKNVTVDEALQLITTQSGFGYQVVNGAYVVGDKSLTAAASVPVADQATLTVTLKALQTKQAGAVLGIAYKDVLWVELPDNRLVLSGDAKRLEAASKFLAELDAATKPQVDMVQLPQAENVEVLYTVKSVVAAQAKQYLENLFSPVLTVAFAPKQAWLVKPEAEKPAAAPAADPNAKPAAPAPAATAKSGWESNTLILRGPKPVVEEALASLKRIDIEVKMMETRVSVKRVFASQAIDYLLARYESRGLVIYTAPMTFAGVGSLGVDTLKGATTALESASKGSQVGNIVRRGDDGKLNIVEPVGDFIVSGPEDVVNEAVKAIAAIDVGPERVEHIYSLRFLTAVEAKKQLEEKYAKEGLQVVLAPPRRGITREVVKSDANASLADTSSGTATTELMKDVTEIILSGPEDVVARTEAMLAQLDTEPDQIAINSEVVSINSSEVNNLGVQWPTSIGTKFTETQSGDALQLGRIIRDPISFNATLNILKNANKAKTINRPSTVVQNGRDALIHVGDTFYYETLAGINNGAPFFQTNVLNTGVTLQVRPIMSRDGVITLEITTNVTDEPTFRRGPSGSDLPIFNQNATTTVVQVRDGETLVIGGLKQSVQHETVQKVPVLGDIPLLGWLFKSKQTTPSQSELMILVTPKVQQRVAVAAPAAP